MTTSASAVEPSANVSRAPLSSCSAPVHGAAQLDAVAGDGAQEDVKQVRAVNEVAVGTVALQRAIVALLREQHRRVLPAPELPPGLDHLPGLGQGLGQPEMAQDPGRVRAHVDARADRAQLGRLLEHGDPGAGPVQEARSAQSAESAAHDRNPQAA